MKKVLLVSPYLYSKTSRGLDVLTECFEDLGWETSHLTFPNVFYTVKRSNPFFTEVKELISKKAALPYVDGLMWWFPKPLFNIMQYYHSRKSRFVDFNVYDYIVLESGKPLFLLNIIPPNLNIIYRQSDPVRYFLGRNKYYIGLEDEVFKRARKIIVVKERFKEILDEQTQLKIEVIRNGYSIPENIALENPYQPDSKNAIYVGLTRLDVNTLRMICQNNPDVKVHIFGNCLTGLDLWKLRKFSNFFFYGFQPKEKYLSYIKFADVAVYPFKSTRGMKQMGFTTKYLNFMYFHLPIVSYLTGEESEFEGMGLHFATDSVDFADKVSMVIKTGKKVISGIDFNYYAHDQRKAEYKKLINSL